MVSGKVKEAITNNDSLSLALILHGQNAQDLNEEFVRAEGVSFLQVAVQKDSVACLNILLQHSYMLQSTHLDSCLYLACQLGHFECASALLSNGADPSKFFFGENSLHVASKEGNVKLVTLLIDSEMEVHMTTSEGYTALHLACEHDNAEILEYFLSLDFLSQHTVYHKVFPLNVAALAGNDACLRILLDHGVDIEAIDLLNRTALHYASDPCVKTLVERGACVDIRDIHGRTPLIMKAMRGLQAGTKALVDGGADTSIKDNLGTTAFEHAMSSAHLACAHIISNASFNLD